ncbi:polysaccharide biosynthesis tyrosine autokinase [Tenggerimyces flavus]|uniref:Polysaccharide biosynthesis tyrosine autokinase n=1 Tax=Tenggerimyces flavus TaxID=1708749 RepID=A0ABV7YAS1_9ACTN|nr:polysaccharide biosynthesis tyrosine autokinase [Tenggerimyces flavus]MBM7783840.1 capsular exopolysaccharide synthesis family protein [Tenggerimyces flavus]
MELREYLRTIRKQWLILTICAALAVAAAAILVLRTTPVYAAKTTLFVSVTQTEDSAASAYQGGLFSQQRAKSYTDLVSGESVTTAVIQDLNLQMKPSELAAKVKAKVVPDTVLLDITVTDTDPRRAQALAAAVSSQFAKFVTELERPSPDSPSPIKATVIDAPEVPTSPIAPTPTRTLGLGLVLGLAFGVAIAVLRESLDNSIKTPDVLSARTGAPTLAVIAHDQEAATNPLVVQIEPRSPRAEAFRQLRTNLQFIDVDRSPKTIVLTSSVPSEGKTTTTCNLALTLAQAGQRVILVEGDVRRPRVGEYLGIESAVGLTSVLIGRVDPEDAIQPWGDIPLEVLASGPIPPNPSELLQSRAMQLLLKELDKRADVILIDAPPLLPVTDAALLARQADGAVLIVRHGKTTGDQVEQAIGNLAKVDARLLGTVLNMAPAKGPEAYTYGYGYGYGVEENQNGARDNGASGGGGNSNGTGGGRRRAHRGGEGIAAL